MTRRYVPKLLADLFGISRSEARRAVVEGAVHLDGKPLRMLDIPSEDLDGKTLTLGSRSASFPEVWMGRD